MIDRYNGFSWQTRTLEVRPDRLPPEYEPQPINQNQVQNGHRGPVYPYNGNNHHQHPQGPSGHPGWQRPPHMNHHPMTMANGPSMPGPGMFMPHHQPYLNGQIRSHSPALSFTQNGMPMQMPLSGQNTGSHGYGHMGASPLAGSLTVLKSSRYLASLDASRSSSSPFTGITKSRFKAAFEPRSSFRFITQ
jgi:hypothetical protein